MKFSVAGVCASFCAALAMVPTYQFVTYRLSGTLDRLRKLDMEQHCKGIVHGDGLGGKGCTRMRPGPEVARGTGSAGRSRARFPPSHWLHGIVRHLEGSVCCV